MPHGKTTLGLWLLWVKITYFPEPGMNHPATACAPHPPCAWRPEIADFSIFLSSSKAHQHRGRPIACRPQPGTTWGRQARRLGPVAHLSAAAPVRLVPEARNRPDRHDRRQSGDADRHRRHALAGPRTTLPPCTRVTPRFCLTRQTAKPNKSRRFGRHAAEALLDAMSRGGVAQLVRAAES